ncbi:MAG: YbgC/FadM family acyl-CoA thioesterase [Candidatus Margulisiibacteriota bacterium]
MKNNFNQRVIYQDTDAEGVVYYANYLGFFERGRTELIRQMGISLKKIKEENGIVFAVEKVACDYTSPAFYDDEITIETEIEKVTGARIIFLQSAVRAGKTLVSAKITLFALNIKDFKPVRIPPELKIS